VAETLANVLLVPDAATGVPPTKSKRKTSQSFAALYKLSIILIVPDAGFA
jgi:hypothetical protein